MTVTNADLLEMYENELESLALMRNLREVPAADIDRRERELRSAIADLRADSTDEPPH